jgi:hypothetical protein
MNSSLVKNFAVAVAGVLVAGYIMGQFRGSSNLIAQAHEGFDS